MPSLAERARGFREGLVLGLGAGIAFALAQIGIAILTGRAPTSPLRVFASVGLGEHALTTAPIPSTLLVGVALHLVLSAFFGVLYGAFNARLHPQTQTDWPLHLVMGALYGLVLWCVNYQLVARVLYPWILHLPQALHASMHVLFFGLPLGVMFAATERRVHKSRYASGDAVLGFLPPS